MAAAAGKGRKSMTENLDIEVGINRFRIYPVHPDGGGVTFAEAVSRVFLPAMVQERDGENKPVLLPNGQPKLKKGMKPVFNSKLHGNTKRDLVEEYLNIGLRMAENIKDPEKKKAFLAKLNGQYSDNAQYRLPGVKYKLTYEMYADKLGKGDQVTEFGRLGVSNDVKEKMNKVGAYESTKDPLGMDPWSNPDTGLPAVITKQQNQPGQTKIKPADIYGVTIDKDVDVNDRLIRYPISDERLEKWLELPSLFKLFRNVFKRSDFELQLAGLEMFDADYSIGVFHTEEFLLIAEEISGYYAEEVAPAVAEEEPAEEEEAADEVTGDQFDLLTRLELKSYIAKEKLGITIKQNFTDDQIRDLIRKALVARKLPIGNDEPLPGEIVPVVTPPVTPTVTTTTPSSTGGSAADRLKNLRKSTTTA